MLVEVFRRSWLTGNSWYLQTVRPPFCRSTDISWTQNSRQARIEEQHIAELCSRTPGVLRQWECWQATPYWGGGEPSPLYGPEPACEIGLPTRHRTDLFFDPSPKTRLNERSLACSPLIKSDAMPCSLFGTAHTTGHPPFDIPSLSYLLSPMTSSRTPKRRRFFDETLKKSVSCLLRVALVWMCTALHRAPDRCSDDTERSLFTSQPAPCSVRCLVRAHVRQCNGALGVQRDKIKDTPEGNTQQI